MLKNSIIVTLLVSGGLTERNIRAVRNCPNMINFSPYNEPTSSTTRGGLQLMGDEGSYLPYDKLLCL